MEGDTKRDPSPSPETTTVVSTDQARPGASATEPHSPGVSDPAALVGSHLLHFRIEARLGAGGMGVVYRAYDEKLRRRIALKLLADRPNTDMQSRKLLLREARSAASLSHPN